MLRYLMERNKRRDLVEVISNSLLPTACRNVKR